MQRGVHVLDPKPFVRNGSGIFWFQNLLYTMWRVLWRPKTLCMQCFGSFSVLKSFVRNASGLFSFQSLLYLLFRHTLGPPPPVHYVQINACDKSSIGFLFRAHIYIFYTQSVAEDPPAR